MHVVNIIEEAKVGGPQLRMVRVAAALHGEVDTTIVMPKDNSAAFVSQCELLGVKYKTCNITRITKEFRVAIRYIVFSLYEIIKLVSFFKKGHFDLVHVSGGSWQYKGVIAGKLAGKKVIWHLNDTCMPWVFRKIYFLLSRYADGCIYASERTKDYYSFAGAGVKPEFVIPAPVDVNRFGPDADYKGDEELIRTFEGKVVIGCVANISPIKGLDVLVEAANLVNKNYDDVEFIVVGVIYKNQKNYFDKLSNLCAENNVNNINFVGGRSDVSALLHRFDIYACSSQAESSPLSVWESLAMGKPVVSTDVGDVPLYVRDGVNGFIVDCGDHVAMSEKLSRLIESEKLRLEFGKKSREIAVENLDIKQCAQKHIEAYKTVLYGGND